MHLVVWSLNVRCGEKRHSTNTLSYTHTNTHASHNWKSQRNVKYHPPSCVRSRAEKVKNVFGISSSACIPLRIRERTNKTRLFGNFNESSDKTTKATEQHNAMESNRIEQNPSNWIAFVCCDCAMALQLCATCEMENNNSHVAGMFAMPSVSLCSCASDSLSFAGAFSHLACRICRWNGLPFFGGREREGLCFATFWLCCIVTSREVSTIFTSHSYAECAFSMQKTSHITQTTLAPNGDDQPGVKNKNSGT